MKTSRIHSMTSSTFKNYRPIQQVNDSAYQPGEQYRHEHQQKHEPFKKELKDNEQKQKNEERSSSSVELAESDLPIQLDEALDEKLKQIDKTNKRKKSIQKYRSSI